MNNYKERSKFFVKTVLSVTLAAGCSTAFADQTNTSTPVKSTTSTQSVQKTAAASQATQAAQVNQAAKTVQTQQTAQANQTNAVAQTTKTAETNQANQVSNAAQATTTQEAQSVPTDPNAPVDPTAPVADPTLGDPNFTPPPSLSESEGDFSYDPYEKFNRPVFKFNDTLDSYILKPVASFYNSIMPKPLNEGIHNFFSNINTLPTIANDILQFNFYQATNDLWRFGVNSTVGILGFFDVGTRIGLKPYSNDFGLTLAHWGYKNSNYLVLPFFGPNTPRDGLSIPVDYFAFSLYPYVHPTGTRYALYTLGVIDRRAQLLQFQNVYEEAAIDKYVFVRNAYMQRRAHQIDDTNKRTYSAQMAAEHGEDAGTPEAVVSSDTAVAEPETLPAPPAVASPAASEPKPGTESNPVTKPGSNTPPVGNYDNG